MMLNVEYSDDFHMNRHSETSYTAELLLSNLLRVLPPLTSAVDVGCGVGTWLSVLKSSGVREVCGLDGPWVNAKYLEISATEFKICDFSLNQFPEIGTFDLAISLEVAEHLPPESADLFICYLCGLADFVLFSAAVPFQSGHGHVNEQWQPYWAQKFARHDFISLDIIGKPIWSDPKIHFWYKQNSLLYVRKTRIGDLILDPMSVLTTPVALVHPDLFNTYTSINIENVSFCRRVLRKIKRFCLCLR